MDKCKRVCGNYYFQEHFLVISDVNKDFQVMNKVK